ncbi:MAG: methionyl-tRNA formyltransferase [Lachnospiraceae bacterium]|nr:methionyl-tRNA formyltransferase [Lachnospiraceae bacterium]
MKIVFMGTPDFAAAALKSLIEAGHEIVLTVTQPDKPKGRSGQLQTSPVKDVAVEAGIPVFQPAKIRLPEEVAELKKYEADVYIVAAFGQILSQEILDMPKYGCLNIHASLLPKYRGAAPIQYVIVDGEEKTGITIQQMNAGIDTGDILYTLETDITEDETFETLHDRLTEMGAKAIVDMLPLLEQGKITPVPQNDADSCYVKMIRKEQGHIDFSKSAISIERLVRGLNPWPSAFTFYNGKQMKVWVAKAVADGGNSDAECGTVVAVAKDYIDVQTSEGVLRIFELQLEGKKRMTTQAFLLGMKIPVGSKLG